MDGNEERKRLETEPVPDHIRPPRLSAGPSLTPFLTARASGEDGGEEERRKRKPDEVINRRHEGPASVTLCLSSPHLITLSLRPKASRFAAERVRR